MDACQIYPYVAYNPAIFYIELKSNILTTEVYCYDNTKHLSGIQGVPIELPEWPFTYLVTIGCCYLFKILSL